MGTPALANDYLFVGALIVARIREAVPAIASQDVMAIEDLAALGGDSTRSPVAFVLWENDRFPPAEEARGGRSQAVHQAWTVVLSVRNASQVQADARNQMAGPLLSALHGALAGWVPPGCARPLVRAQGGKRPDYRINSGLYPLTFEILLNL